MANRKWGAPPLPEGVRPYSFKAVVRQPAAQAEAKAPEGWRDEAFDLSRDEVHTADAAGKAEVLAADKADESSWFVPLDPPRPVLEEALPDEDDRERRARIGRWVDARTVDHAMRYREGRAPTWADEEVRDALAHEPRAKDVQLALDWDTTAESGDVEADYPWYEVDAAGHAAAADRSTRANDDAIGLSR